MKQPLPQTSSSTFTPSGPFAAYREVAIEYIASHKRMNAGRDPCIAIRKGTGEFDRWMTLLGTAFGGRVPWEFEQLHRGQLDTITVPCADPSLIASSLAAAIDRHRIAGNRPGEKPTRQPSAAEMQANLETEAKRQALRNRLDDICIAAGVPLSDSPERRRLLLSLLDDALAGIETKAKGRAA